MPQQVIWKGECIPWLDFPEYIPASQVVPFLMWNILDPMVEFDLPQFLFRGRKDDAEAFFWIRFWKKHQGIHDIEVEY